MLEDLLPHYENELTILRKLSKDFARRYPKIAGRLMLEGEVCEDPHVERLIESFAFLAARIHRKLDDEFPEVTEALLSVLYPHFLRPVPSMSIAQLSAAPGAGVGSRQQVPRGTQLLSRPVNGMPVKYRTAYDVVLRGRDATGARAIIAIEMMVVKMEEGLDRVSAATFAWTATAAPMLTGTLVTIIGFTPIGFAQSSAGEKSAITENTTMIAIEMIETMIAKRNETAAPAALSPMKTR